MTVCRLCKQGAGCLTRQTRILLEKRPVARCCGEAIEFEDGTKAYVLSSRWRVSGVVEGGRGGGEGESFLLTHADIAGYRAQGMTASVKHDAGLHQTPIRSNQTCSGYQAGSWRGWRGGGVGGLGGGGVMSNTLGGI